MTALTDQLATLQTRVLDAAEGHAEGAERADDPTMARVFQELHVLHKTHAAALATALAARGVEPDEDGSFLQYVHKAVLNVRAALGALDEGAIAGVLDGEDRLLELYADTLREATADPDLVAILQRQRDDAAAAVARLRALEPAAR